MDRSPTGYPAWNQALGFWCRLWQAQIDQSLRLWAVWASALPRPDSAELAAEAEAMRAAATPDTAPDKPATRTRRAPRTATPAVPRSEGATMH